MKNKLERSGLRVFGQSKSEREIPHFGRGMIAIGNATVCLVAVPTAATKNASVIVFIKVGLARLYVTETVVSV